MVLRGVGEVGCSHCKTIGAHTACQICTRLICEKCAADWATCDQPSGREIRLGMSARVRDIDPLGRFAIVSHWRRPMRMFDLRQLRWVDGVELSRHWWLVGRDHPPRLTSDGKLVHIEFVDTDGFMETRTLHWLSIRDRRSIACVADTPSRGTGVSAVNDRFWYIAQTERVVVMHQRGPVIDFERYEPLPRKVVQAAHIDGERDLLASATWGELALHRMVGSELKHLGRVKTWMEGNVDWVAVAGPYLAALVARGGISFDSYLEVLRLEPDHSIGPVVYREAIGGHCIAALSRDGRHLAVSVGDRLRVRELDTGTTTDYEGHSDRINYIRFAADDHVLISADTDNRVILRPRTPTGYARPLIPISVPAG